VAHLTLPMHASAPVVVLGLLRARLRWDVLADRRARLDARQTPEQLLAALRDPRMQAWTPPGGGATGALIHAVIHGLDITEALNLDRRPPATRTRTVLDAAAEAGGARVVHCSTIAALGRARPGEVADESAPHPGTFGSVYEETKRRGHEIAVERARAGQDIVLVMPGATYGVGDQSVIGLLLRLWAKRVLIACPFQGTGLSWVAVEDVAAGMLSAHDRGLSGEGYVLGGDNATLAQAFERVGPLAGLRAPRRMPEALLRAVVPVSGPFVRMLGQEPDLLREGLASLRGSWMFSSAKAARDLGYTFRSIEDGIVATLRAH